MDRVVDRHGDTWTRTDRLWRRDQPPHVVLDEQQLTACYGPVRAGHCPGCVCPTRQETRG